MKWKFLFLLITMIMPMSLYADWKVISQDNTVDTSDPDSIGWRLWDYPELEKLLLGFDLSRPDKVVVTHLTGEINTMKWENDEFCQVSDPELIKPITITQIDFDAYWTADPTQIGHGFIHEYLMSPCGLTPIPIPTSLLKTKIKFNGHSKII